MTPSASSSANPEPARGPPPWLLVDANILLRMARPGFPWRGEVEELLGPVRIAVPSSVLAELDALVARGVSDAGAARTMARGFPALDGPGRGDDAIIALALRRQATVFTADRELADRLLTLGRDVLVPRDRSRLTLRRSSAPTVRPTSVRATVKKRARLRNGTPVGSGRHARR